MKNMIMIEDISVILNTPIEDIEKKEVCNAIQMLYFLYSLMY